MASVLLLKDDINSINFIDDSTYKYIDGTFEAGIPTRNEVRLDTVTGDGRDLITMAYKNRIISFDFFIVAATDDAVHTAVTTLTRMLIRASSPIYLSGGGYQFTPSMTDGDNTGDNGLILRVRMKAATSTSVTKETGGSSTDTGILSYRIISGDLAVDNQFESARDFGTQKYAQCTITLEAEPFALGDARIIGSATGSGYYAYPVAPTESKYNRMLIAAATIPGDAPALTRISTNITSGAGIIIGRDAGISVLNSCSIPDQIVGTGKDDLFVWGQRFLNTGLNMRVKITGTGTPNTFAWSDNGGSSYSSNINIVAKTGIQLGSHDIYAFFSDSTGHTLNDTWSFRDNQAYIPGEGGSYDIYTNRNTYYTESGGGVGYARFTIPPGCTSRYRVYADVAISNVSVYEFKLAVSFMGYDGSSTMVTSNPQLYSWIRPLSLAVDLGMVDLSPRMLPFLLHPGGFSVARLDVSMRALSEITSPATCQVENFFLVPAQDDYSYLHAAWDYDGAGREIYCNFDPNNPYIAEALNNHFDSQTDNANLAGLDFTAAGNVITLIPGVNNTVYFLPMFSSSTVDWRETVFSASSRTNETSLAIRPRYLFGG